MSCYQIYFSPTGGTKKVLDLISKPWEEFPIESIDLSIPTTNFSNYSFQEEDICFIAVPSFGGRVPEIAVKRLSNMNGEQALAVIICVYGNRAYEDTLLELKTVLEKANFRCVAAVAANAQHSIMQQFGQGRPDEQDQQQLLSYGEKIKEKLEQDTNYQSISVPGNSSYREYYGVPFKPKADRNCTCCKLCAKQCPVQAIRLENPKITDHRKCIACMRCVSICPNHARDLNPLMVSVSVQKMKKYCTTRKENELFL